MKANTLIPIVLLFANLSVSHAIEVKIEKKSGTAEENRTSDNATQNYIVDDAFNRDEIGNRYTVENHDPARMSLTDDEFIIVTSQELTNKVWLKEKISDDFDARLEITMELTESNYISLRYLINDKELLMMGVGAAPLHEITPWTGRGLAQAGRRIYFTKIIDGKWNEILFNPENDPGTLHERDLKGYSLEPEIWKFSIRREGVRYHGYVSTDGERWERVGTHILTGGHGQLGFSAGIPRYRSGIESAAVIDRFSVRHR